MGFVVGEFAYLNSCLDFKAGSTYSGGDRRTALDGLFMSGLSVGPPFA
jgi:hypothetical protein